MSAQLASGISWAWSVANADIINNSWGDWDGDHSDILNPTRSAILEEPL